MRAVMAFLALGRLTSHPGPQNRPESTFFRTENRAVMGFNKKDLGDVVWSSETSRDPVFLTSPPKDIDYPQLLSIQTLDRRTTGTTLFQMERRPFIRSGPVQAETAYRANQYQCVWDSTRAKYSPNPAPTSLAKARGCASFVGIASTTLQTDERSGERPESPRRP